MGKMKELLTLTQAEIDLLIKQKLAGFDYRKQYKDVNNSFILYINFGSCSYDLARYNLSTQYLMLLRPNYYIPSNDILASFVKACEKVRCA